MEKSELRDLLDRYLRDEISAEEKEKLFQWYNEFEKDPEYTSELNLIQKHQLKDSMWLGIENKVSIDSQKNRNRFFIRHKLFALAASVSAILLLAFASIYFLEEGKSVYQTNYGEIKTIILPDSSKVVLNGNTRLICSSNWDDSNHPREVWLQGEAFFDVQHRQRDQKFLVHTSDSVHIEVVGTEFNVSNRQKKTEIYLKSGKIKLNMISSSKTNAAQAMMLDPGDAITLSENNVVQPLLKTQKEKKAEEAYYSWKEKKLLLDGTTLQEIVEDIKQTHNLDIEVQSKEIENILASGSIPLSDDAQKLLSNIAQLYEVSLEKKGNKWLIRNDN